MKDRSPLRSNNMDPESQTQSLVSETPTRADPAFCGLPAFLFAGICYCAARSVATHGNPECQLGLLKKCLMWSHLQRLDGHAQQACAGVVLVPGAHVAAVLPMRSRSRPGKGLRNAWPNQAVTAPQERSRPSVVSLMGCAMRKSRH